MSDAASFDAIMQCNLLEVFCEALGAAIFVTNKLDELSFASVRLLHFFPISESAIAPGNRARDLYGALFDAGCRFGASGGCKDRKREDWIAERVASAWKERVDTIEQSGSDRWFHIVSRRFASGLGLTVIQDVSEHKKKELHWRTEQERVRMTEEILDTLPVAIAVKDRNLNFAAVNQQFCKMLKIQPDAVLGHSVWDILEPNLANSFEEADWHLLASGDDREAIIKIQRAEGTAARVIHRAKRIGKPGSHFLSMSFDEIPFESDVDAIPDAAADMTVMEGRDGLSAIDGDGASLARRDGKRMSKKVAYVVNGEKAGTGELAASAASHGIELCIIRNEKEFMAFLPAIRDAGISLDLVIIDANAGFSFATQAARDGIRHRTLSPGTDVIESILDAFERRPRAVPVPARPEPQQRAGQVDILAVEDNPVNRMVLEQIFESLGLDFAVVTNGQEALEKVAGQCPRLILADITLPDMEAGALVTALEPILAQAGARPPLIALITGDSPEQRQAARSAGFEDSISKPLSTDAIDLMLRRHLFCEKPAINSSTKTAA